MKNAITHLIIILVFFTSTCYGQTIFKKDTLKIKDLKFESWFAYIKKGKKVYNYSLLGKKFFTIENTKNSDSLIVTWIKRHPNALVIPIYTFETNHIGYNQTYCWVVDNSENLNLFLVRNGAIPSIAMERPKTWKEMSSEEKKSYGDEPKEQIHIDEKHYIDFIKKLIKADKYARKEKLGIYSD